MSKRAVAGIGDTEPLWLKHYGDDYHDVVGQRMFHSVLESLARAADGGL